VTGAIPEALILDLGGVLTHPPADDRVQAMADRLGVSKARFERAYWQHRSAYDAGLSGPRYWHQVLADVERQGDDATIAWLTEQDIASWTVYREGVWELARAYRGAGGRTALLSNGVPEIMARLRGDRRLDDWFDAVVVSYEVALSKPDPRIYALCLARLGVAPPVALFVDDREDNVEGARRAGLQALRFTGDETVPALRARLFGTAP
jgi:putative hydrolase of the HAD superfamily